MKPFNKDKGIENDYDYSCIASELFECFLEQLIRDLSMTREINEDDDLVPDRCAFVYTQKAVRVIENYRNRLYRIGEAHFPDGDINISSYLYNEY